MSTDKQEALTSLEQVYAGMIDESDKKYQDHIDASKQWADTQEQLQNEQTDFAIEQIEQQKEQAKQDYTKEQSGAYTDWQKQSAKHGVNAEKMAVQGMQNTGYSESAQVSMYNTYQNRVAVAREGYTRAVLNYDNAMKEARLQNNAILAQIAYSTLQQQLELSLQGFQYKNSLISKADNSVSYQAVLEQINNEKTLANDSGSNQNDSDATVDMDSVRALGYGDISASTLNDYVSRGIVVEYEENGKLKYRKVSSGHAGGR
jgi:hypothetical protein